MRDANGIVAIMSLIVPILFLPAVFLFATSVVNMVRASQHMRHDQRWQTRLNVVVWLSEYRTKATFDAEGQALIRRARKYRRWFLRYCLFLLIVLLGIGAFENLGSV